MSEKTSTQSLKEVLAKTDEQIMANWSSLGSLIKNFEKVSWQEASKMARELLRDGNAMDYIEQVRLCIISKQERVNSHVLEILNQREREESNEKIQLSELNSSMENTSSGSSITIRGVDQKNEIEYVLSKSATLDALGKGFNGSMVVV